MASLWVVEFDGGTPNGMQVANGNVIITQKVTISGTTAKSAALNDRTKLVMLFADAACCFKFSPTGTDVVATTSDAPLAAESPLFFAARSGQAVAAITR